MPPASGPSLKFLGTAGARFAVSTQLRHSGGLLWRLGGTSLWADPGPGALVRALSARPPVEPSAVDALLVSHRFSDLDALAGKARSPPARRAPPARLPERDAD